MIDTKTLTITHEILYQVAKIDEFKGQWLSLGVMPPERLNTWRELSTIASVGSSLRLDGVCLNNTQVEEVITKIPEQQFVTRKEQEIAGYTEVLKLVLDSWEEIYLTEYQIKQFHSDVFKYCNTDSTQSGPYKNSTQTDSDLKDGGLMLGGGATSFETPRLMREVITWVNTTLEAKSLHPLLALAMFIAVYLKIQPFQEGNGRLCRILTTLLLLKTGYKFIPYYSLDCLIEKHDTDYELALRQTHATIRTRNPDWQPWIKYIMQMLVNHTLGLSEKIKNEKAIHKDLPIISLQIIDCVKQRGRITMGEMIALTGISRNTLKDHFRSLLKNNHLKLLKKGRGSWYELP